MSEQTIELLYGKGTVRLTPPPGSRPTVIRKHVMPVLPDPAGAVREALARPVATPPLAELARGKRSACILICDITRPVPNGLFLRPMIETLMEAGVPREAISIVVATGLHRPNEGTELVELVGDPWVLDHVAVHNHFATRDEDHVFLGRTRTRGTEVGIDRRFVEAELKIATGLVEPHFMAGWSGGRKVIAPGVAHARTITTFHNSAFMADPCAANCVLEGNPLHEEQLQIVGMLGGAYALNTVIDEHRRLAFVNFGEIVQSHLEAVAFVRGYAAVEVKRRFKTVVTSAAGYPLDKTYYQTVKGMVGPLDILEPGGDLIIASACSEGLGSRHYVEAQRRLVAQGVEGFWEGIRDKPHADIDEWQTQMQLKPMRTGTVHLHSDGLDAAQMALTGVVPVADLDAALAESLRRHGEDSFAVVPEGPYVVPIHGG
ncbi:nickel-dependent lactate racemase [Geminicoccaceae bacterium 1502E]|nr:nickel-dependent lactate racemase [Geminicoccaceae bacterium 1502E]